VLKSERKINENLIIRDCFDLGVEETKAIFCPFCRARHESKLYVTRIKEGILYSCKRGTCGRKGFISSIPSTTQLELATFKKKFKPKEFKYSLEELPEWVLSTINKKYELTEEEIHAQGFKWVPEQSRIFMPLFDRRGEQWGANTKIFGEKARGAKTLVYQSRECSRLHYVQGGEGRGDPIAVSEDILSAVKISRLTKAVALLGTELRERQVAELREQTDSLILMLDPDMYFKMLKYKKKYSFYFRNFNVILGSKDPKDLSQRELEEKLSEINYSR